MMIKQTNAVTEQPNEDVLDRMSASLNEEGLTYEGLHEPGHSPYCRECRDTARPFAVAALNAVMDDAAVGRAVKAVADYDGYNSECPPDDEDLAWYGGLVKVALRAALGQEDA